MLALKPLVKQTSSDAVPKNQSGLETDEVLEKHEKNIEGGLGANEASVKRNRMKPRTSNLLCMMGKRQSVGRGESGLEGVYSTGMSNGFQHIDKIRTGVAKFVLDSTPLKGGWQ